MARLARKVMTHHLGQLALFDCFGTPLVSYPDRLSVVGDHPAARTSGESLASNDEDDSDALVAAGHWPKDIQVPALTTEDRQA